MEGKVLTASLLKNPDDWYNQVWTSPMTHCKTSLRDGQMFRYTASSVIAVAFGRRILDVTTDTAYQKLGASIEFMVQMSVPGAQCE
jgi:hypothetical protein